MNWWLRIRRRRSLERDLAEEIAFHKHMRSQDASPPPFGNETIIREHIRGMWSFGFVESTLKDLALAFRGLRKSPAFAVTVIASLAIGIGAVVAIFTAADSLLFRPLPYRDPASLVMLLETNRGAPQTPLNNVSPDNFLAWKSLNSVFQGMAFIDEGRSVFGDGNQTQELRAQRVPPDFFQILGVQPVLGNTASRLAVEEQVVISYRLWQNWFGGAADVTRRKVQLDLFPRTIAAVMPSGFSFGDREVDLWPYMEIYPSGQEKGARSMQTVARLKAGVSVAQAQAQMTAIARRLERDDPKFNQDWTVALVNLRDAFSQRVRTSLLLLMGAVTLLLAVACANAANLLLGRYSARRAEMAIRVALGAGKWRLVRQLLTESLLIAVCSGMIGLALGRWALAGLIAIAPQALTQAADVSIDWRLILFAVGLSTVTGIACGLVPAILQVSSPKRRAASGYRLRAWLIAGEIAVSIVLVASGSLLFRSLVRLQHVDSGMNPRNILTFHFRVVSPLDAVRFSETIREIQKLPGVRSASATSFLPFDGSAPSVSVKIGGDTGSTATVRTILPGYFRTMGIPLLQGRDFAEADDHEQAALRFIVSESFVKRYLGRQEALTSSVTVAMARNNQPGRIVGVVGDVKEGSLGKAPVPTLYYLHSRMPYGQMTLVVRTESDPLFLAPAIRRIVRQVDPQLAVADLRTMETVLEQTSSRERFLAVLMAGFSGCALLLAAIGIYGVLAFSVSLREHEIGIRQALGADAPQIVRMVLANASWFVIAGMVAGIAATFAVTRLLAGLLYDTSVNDPGAFAFSLALMLAVALAAAYVPARRASRFDPMRTLRCE